MDHKNFGFTMTVNKIPLSLFSPLKQSTHIQACAQYAEDRPRRGMILYRRI